MTEVEKVDKLLELLLGIFQDMNMHPKCEVCIAIKLVRVRSLVNNLFDEYERFLD